MEVGLGNRRGRCGLGLTSGLRRGRARLRGCSRHAGGVGCGRADNEVPVLAVEAAHLGDAADIDEMVEHREPQCQHGYQTLTPGDDLGLIAQLAQEADCFGDAPRRVVLEGRRFHESHASDRPSNATWPPWALSGSPTRIHYTTSKGGVLSFTRTLAREVGPSGIRVNAIAPGSTLSEEHPDEGVLAMRNAPVSARALPRVQLPNDLVGSVVFFASPDSDFITGQTLVVDGGATMH